MSRAVATLVVSFSVCIVHCCRSDSRRKHIKEAFDRMVRFHEDMINALTWLTSAESKVAELDSAVEATSTEEQQDMEALRKELKVGFLLCCGRRGGVMVSALDSGSSGPGSSAGRGHCVVFLGKKRYPQQCFSPSRRIDEYRRRNAGERG